jgi:hypothetical protein
MKDNHEGDEMSPLFVVRNRTGALVATLLVAGLTACGSQQQPVTPETAAPKASAPAAAPAPRAPAPVRVTVPQGTELHVTLATAIGSETSQVGDALTATTTAPVLVGDRVAIPAGSTIRGRVTQVVVGKKGLKVSEKGGSIALSFDQVTTPRGFSTAMSGSLTQMASSGGSAAGGAVLGKILGGSTKDAAIGAAIGGGIGTGVAAGTKGKELKIPAGTNLAITLDRALDIADRS